MNCEQKPKNLGNYSSTHLGPAAATRDLERCFVLRIPVHGPLMNPIFGITLINCKRPWWTMMTHAQTHTQTLHNHVFGFLSYILSYFVIWKMVFLCFWWHLGSPSACSKFFGRCMLRSRQHDGHKRREVPKASVTCGISARVYDVCTYYVCTIHVLYIIWTIVQTHWKLYIDI